ncbi:MAG: hypothetical protein ACK55Z_21715, partial [bacterium]
MCASDDAQKTPCNARLLVCSDWKRSTGQIWQASAGSDDAQKSEPKSAIAFAGSSTESRLCASDDA